MDITEKYTNKTDDYTITLLQVADSQGVKIRATLQFTGENTIHLTAPTSSMEATEELLAKIPPPKAQPEPAKAQPPTPTK
jgi:Mg-chelatase subunit ChlD